MKIVYLSTLVAKNTGVPKKIHSALKAMRGLGHDIKFIPLGPLYGWDDQFKPFLLEGSESFLEVKQSTWIPRLRKMVILTKLLKKSGADVVFYRYYPSPLALISLVLSGIPFVTEHNTIEIDEIAKGGKRKDLRRERLLGWMIRAASKGFVAVTPEILNHQITRMGKNKRGIVVSNSTNLAEHPVYKTEVLKSCRLVLVANIEYWQGLDRIVGLLERLDSFNLFVIGDGRSMDAIQEMVKQKNLLGRIHFLGEMYGDELDKFICSCDIAISSLATHRKGILQACPLKTRHYLALGIPVVIGYEDIDLSAELPFIMRVPSDDSTIDNNAFEEFHNYVTSHPEICSEIRQFAEEHLSVNAKMSKLTAFLKEISENHF